jgi:hypothetical protein
MSAVRRPSENDQDFVSLPGRCSDALRISNKKLIGLIESSVDSEKVVFILGQTLKIIADLDQIRIQMS